jgi:hypothetical protein
VFLLVAMTMPARIANVVDRITYALVTWERFPLTIGTRITPGRLGGYYIDFRTKVDSSTWPPPWFPYPGFHRYMAIAQWGLGSYERYVCGEGDEWLAAASQAAEHLVETQESAGRHRGGWLEPRAYGHTYPITGPWLSAMAQGQCASLLLRVHGETGAPPLAEAACSAMRPMTVASQEGGVRASLAGGTFLEEYPTDPPSFVLNGGIFALWGAYDVWIALGEERARHVLADMTDTLEASLGRWDLGYWSRYDLFPHRMIAVASSFYHYLHIHQLRALEMIAPGKEFGSMADRFASYAASRSCRTHAFVRKAVFRLVVPKT